MIPEDLAQCIACTAPTFDLPVKLVKAVCLVESSGKWHAERYERKWRWWVGRALSSRERLGQATSWGPMQVMGAVARELGFKGDFNELNGPLGVEYGCRKLSRLYNRYGSWDRATRAYNTGRPGPSHWGDIYLAKVKKALTQV